MVWAALRNRMPNPLVVKFYLYMATASNAFVTPIAVVYMQQQGLSLTAIGTVQAIFWVGMTLGEVPTGYIGDRIGRQNSVIVATVTIAVAIAAHAFVSSFIGFLLVYLLWALGVTFRSGSLGAWLYESLDERLDTDEYARIKGRGGSVVLLASAVGSLAGGVLYGLNTAIPFLATAGVTIFGVGVLLTVPQPETDTEDGESLAFLDAVRIARDHLLAGELRWFVVYTGLLYVAHEVVGGFIQPIALSVGLDVEQIGAFVAGLMVVSAVGSYFAGTIKDRLGVKRWFAIAPILVAVPLLASAVVPAAGLAAIVGLRVVDKTSSSIRGQYINDRTESIGRATVLSSVRMVFGVVAAPAGIVAGTLSDELSLFVMLATLGVIVMFGTVSIYVGTTPFTTQRPTGTQSD